MKRNLHNTTIGLLLGLSALAPAAARAAEPTGKPTILLVHGAFAESLSWEAVVERLIADGFPVVAAANPLRGLRNDPKRSNCRLA